jgi:hypothetical protein
MFRSALLLTVTAATLMANVAMADVYKYKDEKGNIQYTDKPPALPAERLNVKSQRTDVVAATRPQTPSQPAPAQQQARNQPGDQNDATEINAKDKAERCVKARERYDRYMNSQKLYEQDAKGERRYLDASELDAARASAKASMEVMCQ